MKINVEESIRGLWVASGWVGYLSQWFPKLASKNGNFIPLMPGINVLYGRNGAGKTHIIQAIASAAEFKMSAHEGFVLHNPQISGIRNLFPDEKSEYENYDKSYAIFAISADQLLARYRAIETFDRDLGWTDGFDPNGIPRDKEYLVLSILKEFLDSKHALLTRSPVKEVPSTDDPTRMNPPEFTQLVPILLPSDSAPITRMHAKEIHDSYLEFVKSIEEQFTAGSDPNLSVEDNDAEYYAENQRKGEAFDEWVLSWAWSPLMNLRNFGYNDGYSFVDDGRGGNVFNADLLPISIPAAWSYDNRKEYVEFKERSEHRVSLTLTKEVDLPSMPNRYSLKWQDDIISEIAHADIGYKNKDHMAEFIDQPELYENLLKDYLSLIKAKLSFLPNFRGLEISKSVYKRLPSLVINKNVPVSRGSGAERRWLYLAKESIRTPTQWIVIDEPEAGLHRVAEAGLVQALSSNIWNEGSIIVVASHSPEFLDLPNAHINHVDDGRVRALTEIDREDLVSLGLRPGDLLGQIRTFLLVEGEHEKIIFENLFGEEMRRSGCKIIVARGAKNMKDIFESQMIFNFSDATIVSLLDNIDSLAVNTIWSESKKMAEVGKLIEAGQFIRSSLLGKNHSENTFLSQFLTLALATGQHERVEVWGLSKADIVLYFEPEDFGIKRPWGELLAIHSSADPSFKEWATKKYGADFTVQAVDRASRNLEVAPEEFMSLMRRISELSFRSMTNGNLY